MTTKSRRNSRTRPPAKRANLLPWLIGLVVLGLVAALVLYNQRQAAALPGEQVASQGNLHIAEGAPLPAYNTNPPTSGPHYPNIARAGTYDYELPDPLLVHNLEDGYVVLYYKMGTEEENQERMLNLENASRGFQRVVIAPRSTMDATYALTAWTRLDTFDEFDEARARDFIQAYHGIDHHPRR